MIDTLTWSSVPSEDVCICGLGARTPLGRNVPASAAAVRGAISAVGAHPVWVDKSGEPMSMACDPDLDVAVGVHHRMEDMLVFAMTEALGTAFVAKRWGRIECLIGVSESRPGLTPQLATSVASAVSRALGGYAAPVRMFPHGHAAGLMAIQAAAQRLSRREVDLCIVAGVESYHDPDTLEWLDDRGFLKSRENRNGFPPGEGAGACLLARRSTAARYGLAILATVRAASTAVEPHPIRSTGVCIGEGLSAVIRQVTAGLQLPGEAVTATYCDLNGERYRNEEFLYTLLRVQEWFEDAHDYECPADCWGDMGAASGPLFACLAIAAAQRGFAKGNRPVLWASSVDGRRTAVLLTTAAGAQGVRQ